MANLLDAIRVEFLSRLQTQTNWGKNQVEKLYTEVERDVLSSKFTNEQITDNSHWSEHKNLMDEKIKLMPIPRDDFAKLGERFRPHGSAAYDENDIHPTIHGVDYGDDNPFKDDEDINKG